MFHLEPTIGLIILIQNMIIMHINTSGTTVAAIVFFIAMAPATMGMSMFIAGLLAIGVVAAAGVPAYLVYSSKLDAENTFGKCS